MSASVIKFRKNSRWCRRRRAVGLPCWIAVGLPCWIADGQLTARRRRHHLEFFRNLMTTGVSTVHTLSNGMVQYSNGYWLLTLLRCFNLRLRPWNDQNGKQTHIVSGGQLAHRSDRQPNTPTITCGVIWKLGGYDIFWNAAAAYNRRVYAVCRIVFAPRLNLSPPSNRVPFEGTKTQTESK